MLQKWQSAPRMMAHPLAHSPVSELLAKAKTECNLFEQCPEFIDQQCGTSWNIIMQEVSQLLEQPDLGGLLEHVTCSVLDTGFKCLARLSPDQVASLARCALSRVHAWLPAGRATAVISNRV